MKKTNDQTLGAFEGAARRLKITQGELTKVLAEELGRRDFRIACVGFDFDNRTPYGIQIGPPFELSLMRRGDMTPLRAAEMLCLKAQPVR